MPRVEHRLSWPRPRFPKKAFFDVGFLDESRSSTNRQSRRFVVVEKAWAAESQ